MITSVRAMETHKNWTPVRVDAPNPERDALTQPALPQIRFFGSIGEARFDALLNRRIGRESCTYHPPAVFRLLLRRRDKTNHPSRNIANRLIAAVIFLTVRNQKPPSRYAILRGGVREHNPLPSSTERGSAPLPPVEPPPFVTVALLPFSIVTEQLMAVDTAPAVFFVQA